MILVVRQAGVAEWQTHYLEGVAGYGLYGFKSHHLHHLIK